VGILCTLLQLYSLAVLAWVILSWVQVPSDHPVARVQLLLDRIIYPVILPLRRVMPSPRVGGAMLDLSPIVLLIGIAVLRGVIC
jgi:YggT family protein